MELRSNNPPHLTYPPSDFSSHCERTPQAGCKAKGRKHLSAPPAEGGRRLGVCARARVLRIRASQCHRPEGPAASVIGSAAPNSLTLEGAHRPAVARLSSHHRGSSSEGVRCTGAGADDRRIGPPPARGQAVNRMAGFWHTPAVGLTSGDGRRCPIADRSRRQLWSPGVRRQRYPQRLNGTGHPPQRPGNPDAVGSLARLGRGRSRSELR